MNGRVLQYSTQAIFRFGCFWLIGQFLLQYNKVVSIRFLIMVNTHFVLFKNFISKTSSKLGLVRVYCVTALVKDFCTFDKIMQMTIHSKLIGDVVYHFIYLFVYKYVQQYLNPVNFARQLITSDTKNISVTTCDIFLLYVFY